MENDDALWFVWALDFGGRVRPVTRAGRLHRVCFWWLKAMSEAVDAGLLAREAVLLPWVETVRGQTVSELLVPQLALLSSGRLALPQAGGAG